jgi:hypothetical protein
VGCSLGALSMQQYDWNERYKIFKNHIIRDKNE